MEIISWFEADGLAEELILVELLVQARTYLSNNGTLEITGGQGVAWEIRRETRYQACFTAVYQFVW
jgi:hypothetical protein